MNNDDELMREIIDTIRQGLSPSIRKKIIDSGCHAIEVWNMGTYEVGFRLHYYTERVALGVLRNE